MPHLYSEEQSHIREGARRALAGIDGKIMLRALLEQTGSYDDRFWSLARDLGWTAMAVPEELDGLGMSAIETLIIAEECGRVLAGAPYLATAFATLHALLLAADQDALCRAVAAGEARIAVAIADRFDARAGDSILRVTRDGRLHGVVHAVLGGAAATHAIVLAREADDQPHLVAIALDTTGVSRDIRPTIDNSRGLADLRFAQASGSILPLDDPMRVAGDCLDRLALYLAAEAVGGGDACIALASDHANQRQAFGQAIGKFQAVKHAIAEMYVANELTRASVLDAAVRIARSDTDVTAYVAAARLNAVHSYDYAAAAATQIHGGIGVTWEADLHLHYRRSRSLALEAGPPVYWEDRIVAALEAA